MNEQWAQLDQIGSDEDRLRLERKRRELRKRARQQIQEARDRVASETPERVEQVRAGTEYLLQRPDLQEPSEPLEPREEEQVDPIQESLAGDLVEGVGETARSVVWGAVQAHEETGRAIRDVLTWLSPEELDRIGAQFDSWVTAGVFDAVPQEALEDGTLDLTKLAFGDRAPAGLYAFIAGVSQFATGLGTTFAPASLALQGGRSALRTAGKAVEKVPGGAKATGAVGAATKAVVGVTDPMVRGAAADFAAFDPQDGVFKPLIELMPGMEGWIPDFMWEREPDEVMLNRLKNAVEGGILGRLGEAVFHTPAQMKALGEMEKRRRARAAKKREERLEQARKQQEEADRLAEQEAEQERIAAAAAERSKPAGEETQLDYDVEETDPSGADEGDTIPSELVSSDEGDVESFDLSGTDEADAVPAGADDTQDLGTDDYVPGGEDWEGGTDWEEPAGEVDWSYYDDQAADLAQEASADAEDAIAARREVERADSAAHEAVELGAAGRGELGWEFGSRDDKFGPENQRSVREAAKEAGQQLWERMRQIREAWKAGRPSRETIGSTVGPALREVREELDESNDAIELGMWVEDVVRNPDRLQIGIPGSDVMVPSGASAKLVADTLFSGSAAKGHPGHTASATRREWWNHYALVRGMSKLIMSTQKSRFGVVGKSGEIEFRSALREVQKELDTVSEMLADRGEDAYLSALKNTNLDLVQKTKEIYAKLNDEELERLANIPIGAREMAQWRMDMDHLPFEKRFEDEIDAPAAQVLLDVDPDDPNQVRVQWGAFSRGASAFLDLSEMSNDVVVRRVAANRGRLAETNQALKELRERNTVSKRVYQDFVKHLRREKGQDAVSDTGRLDLFKTSAEDKERNTVFVKELDEQGKMLTRLLGEKADLEAKLSDELLEDADSESGAAKALSRFTLDVLGMRGKPPKLRSEPQVAADGQARLLSSREVLTALDTLGNALIPLARSAAKPSAQPEVRAKFLQALHKTDAYIRWAFGDDAGMKAALERAALPMDDWVGFAPGRSSPTVPIRTNRRTREQYWVREGNIEVDHVRRRKGVAELVAQSGGSLRVQALAGAIGRSGNPSKALEKFRRWRDMAEYGWDETRTFGGVPGKQVGPILTEVRLNSYLSGVGTSTRNIVSNSLFIPLRMGEQFLADALPVWAGGSPNLGVREAGRRLAMEASELYQGMFDGWWMFKQDMKGEWNRGGRGKQTRLEQLEQQGRVALYDEFVMTDKHDVNLRTSNVGLAELLKDRLEGGPLEVAGSMIDRGIERSLTLPTKFLQSQDVGFKMMNYRAALMREAIQEVDRTQDLTGAEWKQAVMDLVSDAPPELSARAHETARRMTFTQEPEGGWAESMMEVRKRWPTVSAAFVPFFRVLVNVSREGVLRTPIVNRYASPEAKRIYKSGTPEERRLLRAQAMLGGTVIGMGAVMGVNGVLTGGLLGGTPDADKASYRAGKRNHSIRNDKGVWTSYRDLTGIKPLLSLGADLATLANTAYTEAEYRRVVDLWHVAVSTTAGYMDDHVGPEMLRMMADFASGDERAFGYWARRTAAGHVPWSAMRARANRAFVYDGDLVHHEQSGGKGRPDEGRLERALEWLNTLTAEVWDGLQFGGQGYRRHSITTGNPINHSNISERGVLEAGLTQFNAFGGPFLFGIEEGDELRKELERLAYNPGFPKDYLMPYGLGKGAYKQSVELTPKEREWHERAVGKAYSKIGGAFVRSAEYKQASQQVQRLLLQTGWQTALDTARVRLLSDSPFAEDLTARLDRAYEASILQSEEEERERLGRIAAEELGG